MNTFKQLFMLGMLLGAVSCHNAEREFEDFGLTTVCFPYQTPARTIILGKYEQGFNENDNNHCFEIGVSLSGLYHNKEPRYVYVDVDDALLDGVTNVKALPESHYRIMTENPIVIPEGRFKGRIRIQLTDEFFKDPASVAPRNSTNYVIPMRITDMEKIDSVLCGEALVENPNRLKAGDWKTPSKDYTLFGIKYVNPYDGYFLRRGADRLTDASGKELGVIKYRARYVENDELVRTGTESLQTVLVPSLIRRMDNTKRDLMIRLRFNEEKVCDVLDRSENRIGEGEYVVSGDDWGGKKRDVIHIRYRFTDEVHNERHEVCDTLVMRDRDIVFEKFNVAF